MTIKFFSNGKINAKGFKALLTGELFLDNSFKIPFFQQKFSEKSKFKRPKKPGQAQQACLQQCLRPVLGL